MADQKKFNVRAYGIVLRNKKVLIAEERLGELHFFKFPGGGLEFGEGLADCVVRECLEETGKEVGVKEHFYTTDFYQPSAFNDADQLISVYYLVDFIEEILPEPLNSPEENIRLHWFSLSEIYADTFYFTVDKHVAGLLRDRFL